MMNAYCSLLASDNYLKCIYGLYYSYLQTQSKYPMIILATDNLSPITFLLLDNLKIPYLKIPYMEFQQGNKFKCTFNKFFVWQLEQFEKILFLDADIIFVDNIDEYFNTMQIHHDCGPMFLLKPNNQIYLDLISDFYRNNFVTDEEVLIHYFNINNSSCHFPQNQIYHFAWSPKYIDYYNTYNSIKNMIDCIQKNKNIISLNDFIKWQKEQSNICK